MLLPADIGISSDPFGHLPLTVALERAAEITTLLEIGSHGRHSLLSRPNRRSAQGSGLRFTVHGPYWALDTGDPDETRRRAAITTHRRHLEGAADIGALCYVVHPDYSPAARGRDPQALAALQRSLDELRAVQDEYRLPIAIENMPSALTSHFVAPGDIDLSGLGFCLDAGHATISGTLHSFIGDPAIAITHVHLHDNRGRGDWDDPHLALGRGVVETRPALAAARRDGATAILEMLDEASVHESIDHLRASGLLFAPSDHYPAVAG
jgi:sugar phosphate isomerase/epimerase